MQPTHPSPDTRIEPAVLDPATPSPAQGQAPPQSQPAVTPDAQPLINSTISQPLPDGWPQPATTQPAGTPAPAETHGEPRLHASAASTAPPEQAAQRPPTPSRVMINLSKAGSNRHGMIRQVLAANPTVSGIALDSATLDDLQFLSQEASLCPGLRRVSVRLTIGKEQEGHESAIATALAKIPGLTLIEIAVTRSESITYVDKLLGALAKACRPTLESILLQGGQYNSFDIVLAFGSIKNNQPKLKLLALDNAYPDDEAAQQNLMREAARLGSLKHLDLSNQTSEQSAQWLPELLSNNSFESIAVPLDFIDSGAAKSVGDALAANRSIRHLKFDPISFFRIDQNASDADDDHADGDTDSEDAGDDAGDYIGQPLYQAVAEGLAKNQTLESVHFVFDDIDSSDQTLKDTVKDIGLLIAAIGRHPRITEATLEIPEDANFNDVLQLLENAPRLQRLTLIGNLCSPEQYEQLALAIEKHPTLLAFKFLPLMAQRGETMAARAKAGWEIADPGDVFQKLQSRIDTALAQNHAKRLGGALTGMMELREPAPDMLPTPPQEINELIMAQGLASLSGTDRENLIKAFKL